MDQWFISIYYLLGTHKMRRRNSKSVEEDFNQKICHDFVFNVGFWIDT